MEIGDRVLAEAARITRGNISDVRKVGAEVLDALILPGGFGAAKNLCTFATEGVNLKVNPDVERLCMVADMVIDAKGEPKGVEVYEAVMRSAARCTYEEVARVLSGELVPHRDRFRHHFEVMAELEAMCARLAARPTAWTVR